MDRRSVKMAENKKVVITLVKSPIGGKENQKATLKALGLNKMHASVEKYETESNGEICLLSVLW